MFDKRLASSYDPDTWTLVVWIGDKRSVYRNISPFIARKVHETARRNRGRALALLRTKT